MTLGDLVIALGETVKSNGIARKVIAIAEPMDLSFDLDCLVEVLHVTGFPEEADAPLAGSVRLCEQNSFVVDARQARGRPSLNQRRARLGCFFETNQESKAIISGVLFATQGLRQNTACGR